MCALILFFISIFFVVYSTAIILDISEAKVFYSEDYELDERTGGQEYGVRIENQRPFCGRRMLQLSKELTIFYANQTIANDNTKKSSINIFLYQYVSINLKHLNILKLCSKVLIFLTF